MESKEPMAADHIGHFLTEFLEALLEPHLDPMPTRAAEQLERLTREGGLTKDGVESLLEALDPRLRPHYAGDARRLVEVFGLSWRPFYYRPKGREDAGEHPMLSAADVVTLLLKLEGCGFTTDVSSVADAITPAIQNKILIDRSELFVLRYPVRRQLKTRVTVVPLEAPERAPLRDIMTLPSGHAVRLFGGPGGPLQRLEFSAPRSLRPRARRVESEVIGTERRRCLVCSKEYLLGSRQSLAEHRKWHNEFLSCSDPQPHEQLTQLYLPAGGPLRVDPWAAKWLHKEMYLRACMIRQELDYGPMWRNPDGPPYSRAVGFLLIDEDRRITGAYSFEAEPRDNGRWTLKWIWVAPGYRRQGLINAVWPRMVQEFGAFRLEKPLSEPMKAFLKKVGWSESA